MSCIPKRQSLKEFEDLTAEKINRIESFKKIKSRYYDSIIKNKNIYAFTPTQAFEIDQDANQEGMRSSHETINQP